MHFFKASYLIYIHIFKWQHSGHITSNNPTLWQRLYLHSPRSYHCRFEPPNFGTKRKKKRTFIIDLLLFRNIFVLQRYYISLFFKNNPTIVSTWYVLGNISTKSMESTLYSFFKRSKSRAKVPTSQEI